MRRGIAILALALLFHAAPAAAEDATVCKQGKKALDTGDNVYAVRLYTLCIHKGQLRSATLARAYYHRGEALRRENKLKAAIADFSAAINIEIGFAEAYVGRAASFSLGGKHALAIVDYERALRFQPDSPNLYYNRALSLIANKEYDRALRDLDKVLSLDRNFIGAVFYNKGIVFSRLRAYDQATQSFDASINRRWTLANAWFERGLRYLLARQYATALASLNNAIVLRPNFGDAFAHRGLAQEGLGQRTRAINDYSLALQFGTPQDWVRSRLETIRIRR